MKISVVLVMLLAPFLHLPLYRTAGEAGLDGQYSNSCSFAVGEDVVNHIWYNDTDGDCRTRDWYLEIVLPDGRIFVARSSDEIRPIEWDLSGKTTCCLLCNNNTVKPDLSGP